MTTTMSRLKEARLARLTGERGFSFRRADIADRAAIEAMCAAASR